MKEIIFALLFLITRTISAFAQFDMNQPFFIEARINVDSFRIESESGPIFSNHEMFNNLLISNNAFSLLKLYNGFKHPDLQNIYLIKIPRCSNLDSFTHNFTRLGIATNIYTDTAVYQTTSCTTPLSVTDPFNHCETVWDMDPKYHLTMTGAECAWGINSGNPNILIAVIDTEFDTNHEELFGKIESVHNNFTSTPATQYHGTGTSGLIIANHNNSFGSAGIGKNIRVRGYKVGGSYFIKESILKAYEDGMRVISVSWASINLVDTNFINAVKEMTQNGTNIVVTSGNTPDANGHIQISEIPGVIVVSSHDKDGNIGTSGHSYQTYVDLVAPGVKVYLPTANPLYTCKMRYATGTSASAPLVSGTIGLMLSANPCLSAIEIEHILKSTTSPITDPSFSPFGYGTGRLNAYEAVKMANETNSSITISSNTTWSSDTTFYGNIIVESGSTLTITGKVYMGCWNKILVKKNAKLIIDGGHITNNNGISKWHGIFVFGNPTKSTNETTEHGYLEIKNNSTLENASYAVNNFFDTDYNGGGIIKISNSTIKNCIRGVNLNYYPNSYWAYTTGLESNCSIINTSFIYDDQNANKHPYMIDDAPRNIYPILSWGTLNGVVIKDCQFNMNIPIDENFTNSQRGVAIYMGSTGAHIENNQINGFLKGIFIENDMSVMRQVKIINNDLNDNYWGIDGLGDINTLILDNDISNFSIWNIPGAAYSGDFISKRRAIYLNSSGLTKIIGNTINYPYHVTTSSAERTYGIVANFTKSHYSIYIGENKFKDHFNHIHAQNDNKGLSSYCNEFDGQYRSAIAYVPTWIEHGIGSHGTGCGSVSHYRANNTFINQRFSSYQLLYDASFLSPSSPALPFYYYALDVTPERITRILDPSIGTIINNNCGTITHTDTIRFCDIIYVPLPLIGITELKDLKNKFYTLKNNQQRYSTEAMYLYGEIIRGYADVYRFQSDSLMSFLRDDNTLMSDLLLIPLYLENNDYDSVRNCINGLNINLDQKNSLSTYYEIEIDLKTNDNFKNINLSPNQIQELTAMINQDSLIVYPYALSLLNRAGLVDYSDKFPIISGNIDSNTQQLRPNFTNDNTLNKFKVYPNPTDNEFTIEYVNKTQSSKPFTLTIISLTGNHIYTTSVLNNKITLEKNALNMSPGHYYVSIQSENQELEFLKIIITK